MNRILNISSQKGQVLALAIVFTLILSIMGGTFIKMAMDERGFSVKSTFPAKAFYLADAGIERTNAWLQTQSSPPGGTAPFDPLGGEQNLGDGNYEITIDPDDGNPGSVNKRYTVTSTGRVEDEQGLVVISTRQTLAEFRMESFARFSYFTNSETNPVYGTIWFYGSGTRQDVIEGPLHSNSQIHIYGNPIFQGLVTSTADSFDYYNGGPPADNPDFQQGYQLGVEQVDMDQSINMNRIQTAAQSGGLYLTGEHKIILNDDGTLTYSPKQGAGWGSPTTVSIPSNGAVFVEGDITISGTLNGRATIAADENHDIYIPDNVVYNTPPTDPNCDDMLGLVAGNSIYVTKGSPAGAGIEIDATLMAFNECFTVQDFRTIPVMGNLTVYGGIIQNYRGPVGTFWASSGECASGYSKDYHYDTRVVDEPPPFYPTTGRYELISWQEQID